MVERVSFGILPKGEGGLGVRNFSMVTKAVDIKRIANFWSSGPSIIANWMRYRL